MRLEFVNTSMGLLIGLGLILLSVLAIVIGCYLKKEKAFLIIKRILVYLSPVISLICVELITENIQTIETTYWVKNIVVYYILFFAIFLFVKSQIIGVIYSSILIVVSLLYHYVLVFRGTPFVLWDIFSWKTAATVVGTYRFELTKEILLAFLIWLVFCIALMLGKKLFFSFKLRVGSLLGYLVFFCIFLLITGKFVTGFSMWDIESNYKSKGLIYTFITEVPYFVVEEPDNYSEDSVQLVSKNIQLKDVEHKTTPENIIFIMNETFADMSYYQEIKGAEDILSYWNLIEENTQRGWVSVPEIGGGTANAEYEALTGNSVEFHVQGSIPYQSASWNNADSLASVLKAQGFYSVALHPNSAFSYNRENVYPAMGFDEFISLENWGEYEMLRWCVTDKNCYDKLFTLTESIEQKTFLFCVTIQNHGGYGWEEYESTVALNYEGEYPQAEQYLSLLKESDKAMQYLLEYYQKCDENTMIVVFGDHQASIEEAFYEELIGKPLNELTFEEKQKRYITPFIIWTNYDIEEKDNMFISSNYLGAYALSLANVKQPAYHHFLLNLMETIPVIGKGGVCDSDGNWYNFNDVPENVNELLNEYEILQYNNMYDKRNRVNSLFDLSE